MRIYTSASLQEQFPEVYQDFFAKNDVVVSGYFGFNWFPVGVLPSQYLLNARSTLQFKCYVGLKKTNNNQTQVRGMFVYRPGRNIFEYLERKEIYTQQFHDCLPKELLPLLASGYEITILSEIGRGQGFGFTGTVLSIIVSVLYMQIYGNQRAILQEYFQDIVMTTQKIHHILNPASVGQGFISTLIQEKGIVFREYPLQLSNIKYGIINDDLLPFDYIVFHSGKYQNSSKIQHVRLHEQQKIISLAEFYKSINQFTNTSIVDELMKKNSLDVFNDNFTLLSVRTVQLLKLMSDYPNHDGYVDDFLHHLNAIKGISEMIEGDSNFGTHLEHLLSKLQTEQRVYAYLPIFTNKNGGDYLLVTKENTHREYVDSLLQELRMFYPHCEIIDTSRNKKGMPGIHCEQWISNNIFSEYIGKDMFLYLDSSGKKIIGSYTYLREHVTPDLLLDASKNKIFHAQEELTSEHLQSKITTIEIFKALFVSQNREIINTSLSPSSFTRQQNQMLGKIIYPLKKYCSTIIGKELGLECHGSLREFHLSLTDSDCIVGLILPLADWIG